MTILGRGLISIFLIIISASASASGSALKSYQTPAGEQFMNYESRLSSDNERYLYNEIEEALVEMDESNSEIWHTTNIDFDSYSKKQCKQVVDIYNKVLYDHPVYTMYVNYKHQISFMDNRFKLTAGNLSDSQKSELEKKTAEILKSCRDEKSIYKYLIKNIKYDDNTGERCNDLYGALVEEKACCGGISYGYKYLLDCIGIKNRVETGYTKSDNVYHMWNVIIVDNEVKYADVTWGLDSRDDSYFSMNYNERTRDVDIRL